MAANKKNETLSDQQAVYHKRKAPRYALKAGININGFEGEGMLGNISASGCLMESSTYVSITPDDLYQVTIKPDEGENIKPFSQKLKASWTKSSEMLFQAGFTVDSGQTSLQMEQYTEMLKLHGVNPDYGNMEKTD